MAKRIHKGKKGFTLIEILVVLIIVGILAAVAVPRYINMMNQGAAQSAANNLQVIYNSQKAYYLDPVHGGSYCINSCDNLNDINTNLHLNITDNLYIYTCSCSYSSSCGNSGSVAYCYAQLNETPSSLNTFLYETAGTPVYGMNTTSPSSGTMSCGSLAGSEGKAAKQCNTAANTCSNPWHYLGQTFDCVSCCST